MTTQPAIIFSLPNMTRAFGQLIGRNIQTGMLSVNWFTQTSDGMNVTVTMSVHPADIIIFVPTRLEAAGREEEFNAFVSFYMNEGDIALMMSA